MVSSFWAITKNAVLEIIRQPIYVILVAAGLALIAISPAITMFSMSDDTKLMVDMGLATILLLGVVLAVLSSTQVVSREIESQTAGAIISKPVGRMVFITAKFFAVGLAMLVSTFLLLAMLLITLRFGVPSHASAGADYIALGGMVLPVVIAVALAMLFNYLYGWSFPFTVVMIALIAYAAALAVQLVVPPVHLHEHTAEGRAHMSAWQWMATERNVVQVAEAALLILLNVWVLSAIAVAVSTRANVVLNTIICFMVFFVAMSAQFLLGPLSSHASRVPVPKGMEVKKETLKEVLDPGNKWPLRSYLEDIHTERFTEPEVTYFKENGEVADVRERRAHPEVDYRAEYKPVEREAVVMKLKHHPEYSGVDLSSKMMQQIGFAEGRDFDKRDIQVWPRYPWIGKLFPHLYVFWVGDQLMADIPYIPPRYLGRSALYAFGYCLSMLLLAAYLFEGREII